MIIATVNINRHRIAQVEIWNDKSGTDREGNYRYKVKLEGEERAGALTGFRRNHPHGAMRLLAMVLRREFPGVPENRYMEPYGGKAE